MVDNFSVLVDDMQRLFLAILPFLAIYKGATLAISLCFQFENKYLALLNARSLKHFCKLTFFTLICSCIICLQYDFSMQGSLFLYEQDNSKLGGFAVIAFSYVRLLTALAFSNVRLLYSKLQMRRSIPKTNIISIYKKKHTHTHTDHLHQKS